MYPFSILYVCKLDCWARILWAFGFALKPGVTEWYQSRVDYRNASLFRRVIFSSLFCNQNYFYSTLFKIFILQLIFAPSYLSINLYYSDDEWWKLQFDQRWQQQCWEPIPDARAAVDCLGSTSWDRRTNPGANARCQSIDAIYGSKTLIKKQAQKISAIKKVTPNHKEGSTSAKANTLYFNCGKVGHFTNRFPQDRGGQNVQSTPTNQTATQNPKGKRCYNCGEGSLCSSMPQSTCSPSSNTVIYFSTTTQPASQRKGEIASRRLRTGMTWIQMTTMWRIGFPKMQVMIRSLS
jgi:hypothetical protein